ncbi:MAG: lasso peptide biosynthesis B2 protein [Gemmatimonadota bacterium]|nr:lasso peptide biosynthesis B2 protein [Gemmatimonadota bacterium]
MLQRLRSFIALPAAERRLALRAIALLGGVRVALRIIPFRQLQRWAARLRPPRKPAESGPVAVRRAVIRAARTLPGSTCLAQAIVAQRLLAQAGYEAALRIGVVSTPTALEPRAIEAHAWVEADGLVVAGEGKIDRYTALASFDRPR